MLSLPRLSRVVLMVRPGQGLVQAMEFYHQGLGLSVIRATDDWCELRASPSSSGSTDNSNNSGSGNLSISLQAVSTEAQLSTGYSPLLHFEIQDMDNVIAKCVQMGGQLDGPIQYPAHGKVAALRSPDGHMIGLYEPAVGE